MVHTDTGSDAHFPAGFLRSFGNGAQDVFVIIHTDSTVIGFLSGSKCRSRRRRIGHRIGSGKGRCHRTRRKCGEQKRLYSNTPFLFSQIHLSTIHLVYPHSISNEIKYILCLLRPNCTYQKYDQQYSYMSSYNLFHCNTPLFINAEQR